MEITIEKLIYGGEGLGHHDGSTVFVPFVLPAERVSAEPVEQKKKFVRARVERVLDPSPERVAPRCPHFGVCGGCDYQHAPYESQLRYKAAILRETLRPHRPNRMARRDYGARVASVGLPQSRAVESPVNRKWRRRGETRDRIFSRRIDRALRRRGLPDPFAAAAEDAARSARRARGRQAPSRIARD